MFELGSATENLLINKNEKNKYYNNTINIDLAEKNCSQSIIANRIEKSSVCLDVGCSAGYMGEALKEKKNCIMYGIEMDNEAIEIAKGKRCYEEIFEFSITDEENIKYKKFFEDDKKFDYIIFADILEHIADPDLILFKFLKKLNKNGKIMISIPNVAHMDISKSLINRQFNYNTVGLLDNTHIRFFTNNSFIQMIESINKKYNLNLNVEQIGKTIVVPNYVKQYPNIYNILNSDEELCVLQYIYEIKNGIKTTNSTLEEKDYYSEIELNLNERNLFSKRINELEEEKTQNQQKYLIEKQELNNNLKNLELTNQNLIKDKESLKEDKEKLTKEITELENQVNSLTKNNENLNQTILSIINSKSWKITSPLRKIMEFVKRLKTKNK